MRLLVLDDDEAIGRFTTRAASLAGFDARAVTDPAQFIADVQADPPHVVVLDLQLGDTDGIEQLRALAGLDFQGTVILVSGFDTRVLATARGIAERLGLKVAAALEKPLRLETLEHTLCRLRMANEPISLERIQSAIANDELFLEFQPVVTRAPRHLLKLEALVRWDHPVNGRIEPGDFLPLAESDVTTIDALSAWVVGAAVGAYQALAELGLRVPIAINMSALNLHDLELPDFIAQQVRAGGMLAGELDVEVTESAAIADNVNILDVLSRLRLKGTALSIDDFGTGYASLRILQRVPYSEIKIDRSFVTDLATSRDSLAIVKSIIDLAANMQMKCVAEGVETEEVADMLEQLGVTALQGWLIARPMAADAVPAWLARWTSAEAAPRAARHHAAHAPAPADSVLTCAQAAVNPGMEASDAPPHLPRRQLQVMCLVAEGCTVKEIARRLGLGVGTVKVHLALAYTALGTRNRIEAIRRLGSVLEYIADQTTQMAGNHSGHDDVNALVA